MSTKIYEGYRIPVEGLSFFIEDYHRWAWRSLLCHIRCIARKGDTNKCAATLCCGEQWSDWWKKHKDDKAVQMNVRAGALIAMGMYENANHEAPFNFDVSINIWILNSFAYIIPYHPNRFPSMARLVRAHQGEEYAYWDNTDMPKGMSEAEWEVRGRVWNGVCLDDWNKRRLQHIVYEGKASNITMLVEVCNKLTRGKLEELSYVVQDAYFRLEKERKQRIIMRQKKEARARKGTKA